ncbi:MAG: ATP-binding cassette domain-containing protein [Armatimonadetes bacterium]|nr:ATP-binding cassette domain-containing protein [Armatimonadota bacterium]NIM24570.1 ATP-binding cassette domain-containing protein [Armatimonadota bacterium]NIM68446.1 ATP-binding cassette domain-containing protein [Armatimonadota bacterium]NIM76832.1 ATP-binding cassette domain-containing protein [Armatimonadota bacterium]NIN06643.1 ATP-binding cassette domain-containing protein [Armatimonadota bacterium]
MSRDSLPVVVLDDVWKVYQMGAVEVNALGGVSLELPAGEFTVLLGPSGSGKTTLLNLVGGLDKPTRGRVLVDGTDLGRLEDAGLTKYRRNSVGFVFQFFNLIPTLTARENVELAAELVNQADQADWALEQVGLADRAHHFPAELSGGEQQRVAIARALAKNPRIMLADEPTGNLDCETGLRVLRSLKDATRTEGRSVLLVTHNSVIAEMADRVVRLHSGEVAEMVCNESPAEPESLSW